MVVMWSGFCGFFGGGGRFYCCLGSFWSCFRDVQDVPELEAIWNLMIYHWDSLMLGVANCVTCTIVSISVAFPAYTWKIFWQNFLDSLSRTLAPFPWYFVHQGASFLPWRNWCLNITQLSWTPLPCRVCSLGILSRRFPFSWISWDPCWNFTCCHFLLA